MKKIIYFLIILLIPFSVFGDTELINNQVDFDLGIYTDTHYNNSGFLELNNAVSVGNYESQIFNLNREVSFTKISWTPFFPVKKELPNNNDSENIYLEGNINMSDNVLLMHLNNTSFLDSSLNSNNGSCNGVNCPIIEEGILDKAARVNGGSLSRISIPDNDTVDPGDSSFSVCHWFKIDDASGTDEILYNKENLYEARVNNGYYNYAWRPHWAWDGGNSFQVNSDEWYHACLVYDKTKQILYKNGEEVFRRNQTGDMGVNSNNLCLGARGTNDCNNSRYTGLIDEFSVWKKTLSPDEIKNIYRRGATNLKIQVRSCDDSQCVDDNYSNLYFDQLESNNILPSNSLSILNNNYFQFKIYLETIDENNSPRLKDISFDYNIINHNPIDISLSSSLINENEQVNTEIGVLSANDIDSLDIHTFSLDCSNPGQDDINFNIDNNKLKSSAVFNYETKSSYDICIKVNDGNGGTYEKNFSISVNDINNSPTDIILSNININENIPSGSIISSISAVDDGEDGNYSYFLEVFGDSAKFNIQGNQLVINESPDYETQNTYNLRIRVNDGVNNFIKDFTINVNDSIENTAPIILNNQNLELDENNNFILAINVQDNDIPVQNFIYFISGGVDADKFSINSVNGKLYFLEKKDFENPDDLDEDNMYNVEVSVIDDGQPRLISSKIFNIKIKDVREKKGKSGKITRKTKIVYRDRIIYKDKKCSIQKNDLFNNAKRCLPTQILTQNMKVGDRNNKYSSWQRGTIKEVKILQKHMNRLGFNAGDVDGILGPITDGAIKRMQKYLGTKADGLVGPKTRKLINNSCN